jgi:hypothetical protein
VGALSGSAIDSGIRGKVTQKRPVYKVGNKKIERVGEVICLDGSKHRLGGLAQSGVCSGSGQPGWTTTRSHSRSHRVCCRHAHEQLGMFGVLLNLSGRPEDTPSLPSS